MATVLLDNDYCKEVQIEVNIEDLPPTSVGSRASPDHYGSPPRRIDWRRTAAWLHECRQSHDECRPKEAGSLSPNFCVIDVHEGKLVRPTLPCRYLALSYVWGSGLDRSKLIAKLSNAKSLQEPGSLQPTLLPRTIADAMVVCRELSERYLWADCLCIMQDDAEDKSEQIGMMASIYTAAQAVLVVASGSSMDQAIPGVSLDRPEKNQSRFLGLRLTESTSKEPWELLESNIWSTRGWTYQEGILPSRKLYIMDREVWFECGEVVVREDVYTDKWKGKYIKRGSKLAREPVSRWLGALHAPGRDESDDQPPWESYHQHLSRYTQRTLGDDRDIFNAFMGILNPLFNDHGGTTFGLPLANFDRALLWADKPSYKNAVSPGLRRGAPTWSWGSMHGQIIAGGQDFIGTLVRWSQYSEAERDLVEVSIPERQWPGGPGIGFIKDATCLAIAWANGLFKEPCPGYLDHNETSFEKLNEITTRIWPSPRDFPKDALEKAELDKYASLDIRKAGILCGRVQTAVLKIVRVSCVSVSRPPEGVKEDYNILDHRGDSVGLINHLPTSTLESQIGPGVLDGGTDAEFLALSVATWVCSPARLCDSPTEMRRQEWSFLDCNGRASYPYPVVNVMLVWTDEEGYSYRIGIGEVVMTKWAEAKRVVRNVALK
ncbi:het-domain-containing protein [Diplodia corticola]|uniref:Het-domain-containing protein n=1 Tax=Diplodia corticola TaxID=236234 RepID=A0A1J9R1R0_9PEZI|nr:het-domain-containing protein [Diplodia corticola]OJD34186.1 het-domain-containing protein [Diplodia corticola]